MRDLEKPLEVYRMRQRDAANPALAIHDHDGAANGSQNSLVLAPLEGQ